jgi:hypothetical protein
MNSCSALQLRFGYHNLCATGRTGYGSLTTIMTREMEGFFAPLRGSHLSSVVPLSSLTNICKPFKLYSARPICFQEIVNESLCDIESEFRYGTFTC